ncbi:MAG: hypothetical protein SGI97_01840 [candidate division Zixibacteria bacterium]|nr:hypothetical protein [candidate division Zixibacteria bacterium]
MSKRHIPAISTADPIVITTAHTRGNMQLAITNNGTIGTFGETFFDPLTQEQILSCVYPKNSDVLYLYVAAFWIGAVVGRDTLVSVGSEDFYVSDELLPEVGGPGIIYRSIDLASNYYSEKAVSEEDIICAYTDKIDNITLAGIDPFDNRPHKPLNIKVNQRSMAWSYEYADDFVLFDYEIQNIGQQRLRKVYMGIWVDGDVWHATRQGPIGWDDDMVGFYRTHPSPEGCGFIDTVNIAWTADNDGDPESGDWDFRSARNAVGVRVVRTPSDSINYSFNWWITNYTDDRLDFGPRRLGTSEEPFRSFGGRLGTPTGDANKYYMMRKQEFDYDLLFTGKNHFFDGWSYPPPEAKDMADGFDTRYLLSFGPFDIDPGQSLPLSFAFVGGTNLHQSTAGIASFNHENPQPYYNELDFSNLALNSRWASWVYDNPGIDTDGDLYSGKFRICNETDTFWYEGDGVPDFRGASPPPAPRVRVVPQEGKLTVRWNGFYSETTKDVFLQEVDYEGYRVYAGLDERKTSLSLRASYDVEDYNRFRWRLVRPDSGAWTLEEIPFTIDSLRLLYADSLFDPLVYSRINPLTSNGELYYFAAQDFNSSALDDSTGIYRVYPAAVNPGADAKLWMPDDITTEFGVPLPKYYTYEIVLSDLLASIPYTIAVTAFDFGSPLVGLASLETSPTTNSITEYPQTSADTVEALDLDAYVYPNPYRSDGGYVEDGYESRRVNQTGDRSGRLHFANLPSVCTISIFSIDGDLIREIDHNFPDGGPSSMHETWDMVTRNTQKVVSGIYYFVVESRDKHQIGKFTIIR